MVEYSQALGKTIRLFLADGSPSGILTAEIINWTGQVMLIPRSLLPKAASRREIKRTGVYILIGPDPEKFARHMAYIGEGDDVLRRILEHDKNKDFWTHTIIVTSKDDNITKSHGRYLESRLINIATLAGRATLQNGTSPDIPRLPESDIADMEYFLAQIQMILPVLGYNLLQAQPDVEKAVSSSTDVSPVFELFKTKKGTAGVKATAREIEGEFVVLKGSTARSQVSKSWDSYIALRGALIEEKKLTSLNSETLVFNENVSFSSPSAAATIVLGRNANGRTNWKVQGTDKTYQDWYDDKVAQVDISNDIK